MSDLFTLDSAGTSTIQYAPCSACGKVPDDLRYGFLVSLSGDKTVFCESCARIAVGLIVQAVQGAIEEGEAAMTILERIEQMQREIDALRAEVEAPKAQREAAWNITWAGPVTVKDGHEQAD